MPDVLALDGDEARLGASVTRVMAWGDWTDWPVTDTRWYEQERSDYVGLIGVGRMA